MNARPDFTPAITLLDTERQRCEIWTRVMGYHRPVASFNIGKQGEFHERQYFTEASAKVGQRACHG
ncbi:MULTISPECIES: anaerobic ribonucleoside-triphosphate reductase [Janthinobacterium]|uniref:anaerobic ribonucleoside-triphosphate reductase n=1 Tax=Janthinobacterium TaxID=29580 RepID=UPI001C5A784C|nr:MULTISPECIES: anaerobic ribonucleoside-triphosphate reductase [Janthinobacterium]MBW3511497.1 anaerobic ribonucleoside-triphosphate reductase [Janthinobacterium sp. NKUCC06_STL]